MKMRTVCQRWGFFRVFDIACSSGTEFCAIKVDNSARLALTSGSYSRHLRINSLIKGE